MANSNPSIALSWSSVCEVAPPSKSLPGDKISLSQSALEQLLSASTLTLPSSLSRNSDFLSFQPSAQAAARVEHSLWQETRQQLPQPLTFRLVNAQNGNVVYAGIREFSAGDGQIELSPFLSEALGLTKSDRPSEPHEENRKAGEDQFVQSPGNRSSAKDKGPYELVQKTESWITVHAKQLPKGKYVRLRPLEAGYNPEDWKSLLERHLRENYTTLTIGEILTVRGTTKSEEFRFLIDKFLPEGDGICVVDTDLEVDIEALNEEQARETFRQIMAKAQKVPGTMDGSSTGGDLDIWKPYHGQIVNGDYIDFQLLSWERSHPVELTLMTEDNPELELFISPFSPHQRARPRENGHTWGRYISSAPKRIEIQPSDMELEGAEALFVSVHARSASSVGPLKFALRAQSLRSAGLESKPLANHDDVAMHGPNEDQCHNCRQWVPKRTMMLHENFCLRNNTLCPHCSNVFQKKSQEWLYHWHCPHDSEHGNMPESKVRHDHIFHTPHKCPNCPYEAPNLPQLASHRTSTCPAKLILCQFCHLEVPQDGDPFDPSPEMLISGLTAHELADGARTTECHLCSKIVRLKDMPTHLKHHDLEKNTRIQPAICRNVNCGRTLSGLGKKGELGPVTRIGPSPGNDIGLCSICFGPLYVSMHDPEGKAMKRRVERRYLSQLITGCGKASCANEYCRSAKRKTGEIGATLTTKDALPMVTPLMKFYSDRNAAMYFCVDDGSQKRRKLAEMLAAEGVYDVAWCIAACEAETGDIDKARTWLQNWAPKRQ